MAWFYRTQKGEHVVRKSKRRRCVTFPFVFLFLFLVTVSRGGGGERGKVLKETWTPQSYPIKYKPKTKENPLSGGMCWHYPTHLSFMGPSFLFYSKLTFKKKGGPCLFSKCWRASLTWCAQVPPTLLAGLNPWNVASLFLGKM